jgi:hypothetical protein
LEPDSLARRLAIVRRFDDASRSIHPPPATTPPERRFYAADLVSLLAAYRGGADARERFRPYDGLCQGVLQPAFHSPARTILYFAALALSAWAWLASRGTSDGAFVVLLLALGRLGAGLIVSLNGLATIRYIAPTEPLAVAAVLLLPMLWIAPGRLRPEGPEC